MQQSFFLAIQCGSHISGLSDLGLHLMAEIIIKCCFCSFGSSDGGLPVHITDPITRPTHRQNHRHSQLAKKERCKYIQRIP